MQPFKTYLLILMAGMVPMPKVISAAESVDYSGYQIDTDSLSRSELLDRLKRRTELSSSDNQHLAEPPGLVQGERMGDVAPHAPSLDQQDDANTPPEPVLSTEFLGGRADYAHLEKIHSTPALEASRIPPAQEDSEEQQDAHQHTHNDAVDFEAIDPIPSDVRLTGHDLASTDSNINQVAFRTAPKCGCRVSCQPCRRCYQSLCGCHCGGPFWANFDLLLWWLDGYSTPPLLTSSPAGAPPGPIGVLGDPSTDILYGGNELGNQIRIGPRIQAGLWLDPCCNVALQGDFFSLGNGGDQRSFSGANLARPFFNTDTGQQDSQLLSLDGESLGNATFSTSSRVYSAAPSLRWNAQCCGDACQSSRIDFLGGYRFFHLSENFAAQEILRPTGPAFADGTRFELNDKISVDNNFHGFEFGTALARRRGPWTVDLTGLLAIGEVVSTVVLDGSTRQTVPYFMDETVSGGFHVGALDIGRRKDRDFALMSQLRSNLSYALTNRTSIRVGYSLVNLSSVVRPSAFISSQLSGSTLGAEPPIGFVKETVPIPRQNVWLHGINIGLTWNY